MTHPTGASPQAIEDARYRQLVESITDYAVYMLDSEGHVSSWNPGARRFKGYEAAEIIGQHFSRFYTEEDRAAGLPARALDIARREGRFEGEGWRLRNDGTRFWVSAVIDPIRDAHGAIIGFAKVTRDLTERKLRDDQLARGERQFRLLVQSVSDYAIYMIDPNGLVTNWNAGAQRIKGYAADEIVGKHFSQFYLPEDRDRGDPQRGLEAALREGRFEKEGWRVRKDGTPFWANVVIDPIRDPDGTLLGFAKITRDISERRENQIALEQTREALFQAQKMEAIGQLTGGVAHDFNNLLMAIISGLELLRKRVPDDPRVTMLLSNAMDAARRGVSLTRRMLAFARRQDLAITHVDVGMLVNGMSDLMERSIGPGIAIQNEIPLNLPQVRVDANQLDNALLNLVLNARDAMPRGGFIRISARLETLATGGPNDLAAGAYVCLSVTDTGHGMDAATLDRAAEPFFTTKGVGKGTGLGLSMVHGMLEQLGGRMILKSQVGEGTTAELWLPVANADTAVRPQAASIDSRHAEGMPTLNILLVDDDRLVLVNTTAMLEEFGHRVTAVSSAHQALTLLRTTEPFDVLVTDHAMPQMSGADLAVAAAQMRPGLPVLLVSGYAELPVEVSRDLRRLSKPFTIEELESAIAGVIGAVPKQA